MKKSKIILLLSAMLLIVSLFAVGCGKTVQLTFNGNGGTLVAGEEVQTVKVGDEIVAPEYVKEGYTLSWDKDLTAITEDATINAVWTANTYTATFKLNDTVESPATLEGGATKEYVYDAAMDIPTPVRTGYTFTGWKLGSEEGADVENGAILKQTANFDLVATWSVNTYAVSFDLNDTVNAPASMEGEATLNYIYDAAMTLPEPTRPGYLFSGWRKGSVDGELLVNGALNKIAANYTAVATWAADDGQTFTIGYNLAGGVMANGDENATIYKASDADITLKNPVKTGYRFIGWTEGSSATPVKNVTIASGSAGNKTYTANWEQIVYTINFVLTAKDDLGVTITTVTIDGQSEVASVTVNACESLGSKLPALSSAVCADENYSVKAWKVMVNGSRVIIDADYLFDTAIFGEADITIDVIVQVNLKWSGQH